MERKFDQVGLFAASDAAERFLRERGFSIGAAQRGKPQAILLGDADIGKWRQLSDADHKALHGVLTGDVIHGPVFIRLHPWAPAEAVAALSHNQEN